MKKDGLLFAALALLGVGVYFFFKNKGAGTRTPATATTGSNPYAPANSFAGLVGAKGSPAASGTGTQAGAAVDLGPLIKAGAKGLADLWKAAASKLFNAGSPNTQSNSPGNTPVAYTPPEWVGVPGRFSTREEYFQAVSDAATMGTSPSNMTSQYEAGNYDYDDDYSFEETSGDTWEEGF